MAEVSFVRAAEWSAQSFAGRGRGGRRRHDDGRPGPARGVFRLVSTPLSCGGVYWGHGGSMTGYETRGGVTEDGRAANVAVTMQPSQAVKGRMDGVVDTALCR